MTHFSRIALVLVVLCSAGACRDKPIKPDTSTVDFTLNWDAVMSIPGGLQPGTDMSGPVSAATSGDLASATLVSLNEGPPRVAKIRFRCADGTTVETDIPLDGVHHETGCKAAGGKPIRIRVRT